MQSKFLFASRHALIALLLCLPGGLSLADGKAGSLIPVQQVHGNQRMVFPDVPGYLTLTADLHTHSIFSDGHVWPNVRVEEARREGLEVLAITEHLEWQPHSKDLPHKNRNRAFEIAANAAAGGPVVILPGAEITREAPVGHINAVFIRDANALQAPQDFSPDPAKIDKIMAQLPDWGAEAEVNRNYALAGLWPVEQALLQVRQQQGFAFWNHPSWAEQAPDGLPPVSKSHERWFKEGLIQGIEVANTDLYSPESFQLALDHNLAIIGTSDVHDLVDWDYPPSLNQHRPVTLIFSKTREAESIRQALLKRRTVVWFRDTLLGREQHLLPLLRKSLTISKAGFAHGTSVLNVQLKNASSVPYLIENVSEYTDQTHTGILTVPALGVLDLKLSMTERKQQLDFRIRVHNALVAPNTALVFSLSAELGE